MEKNKKDINKTLKKMDELDLIVRKNKLIILILKASYECGKENTPKSKLDGLEVLKDALLMIDMLIEENRSLTSDNRKLNLHNAIVDQKNKKLLEDFNHYKASLIKAENEATK